MALSHVEWLYLPTLEDVIAKKLRWSKEAKRGKDFDGAVNVFAVQRDVLEFAYIDSWCQSHQALDTLAEAWALAEV